MKPDPAARAQRFAYNLAAMGIELCRSGELTINGTGDAMTPWLQGEIDRWTDDLILYVPELQQPYGCVPARQPKVMSA